MARLNILSMPRAGLAVATLLCLSGCATAPTSDLQTRVLTELSTPGLAGTRWGVLVETLAGDAVVSIRANERYQPASTTKNFTSAAAFHRLNPSQPLDLETSLSLETSAPGAVPDLVLTGVGDAMLGDGPDCVTHCLADLVDGVVAQGITRINDVIADERLFPVERSAPGWSVEDLDFYYGTGVSALVVNNNTLRLDIAPGPAPGASALIRWQRGDDLMTVTNDIMTVAEGETNFGLERAPGSDTVRLYGVASIADAPVRLRLGTDTPARLAGIRLKRLLVARGIAVDGTVKTRSRGLGLDDDPSDRLETELTQAPYPVVPDPVATLTPPPLADSITQVSKDSDNLHAEILLRHLGRTEGAFSRAAGLAAVEAMLDEAGVDPAGYDLTDGSGMSTYNRISPRAMVDFLRWTHAQDWGEAWRETLPVGGVDGSLARRFIRTPLQRRIFAKTGTLTGANALSGFMLAQSGEVLIFSIVANDRPSEAGSAIAVMDAALLEIAAAN